MGVNKLPRVVTGSDPRSDTLPLDYQATDCAKLIFSSEGQGTAAWQVGTGPCHLFD